MLLTPFNCFQGIRFHHKSSGWHTRRIGKNTSESFTSPLFIELLAGAELASKGNDDSGNNTYDSSPPPLFAASNVSVLIVLTGGFELVADGVADPGNNSWNELRMLLPLPTRARASSCVNASTRFTRVLAEREGESIFRLEKMAATLSEENLSTLTKDELIKVIKNLDNEIKRKEEDFAKIINLRLYTLERNQFMMQQYSRRDSFEISGIKSSIDDMALEDEVIDILKEADVKVNRQHIKKTDIQAVHRLKNGATIVKTVNRKFAREAIYNSKNLKGTKRYGNEKVFINCSFCPEYRFLNYAVRQAKKNNLIHWYKIKNGINYIKVSANSDFIEIGHVNDLVNNNIAVPTRR